MKSKNSLTKKERIFCEEFFRTGKKELSAKKAGYSSKSVAQTAERLLKKEKILEYILKLQEQDLKEKAVNNNWAVLRAIEVYERCMAATPVTKWDSKERCLIETGEYTFDCKEALKALEMIKNLLGLGGEEAINPTTAVTFIDDLGGSNE